MAADIYFEGAVEVVIVAESLAYILEIEVLAVSAFSPDLTWCKDDISQ